VTLPTGGTTAQDWPAGVYLVTVTLIRPDETDPRTTNVAAMLLAPEPQLGTAALVRRATTPNVTATLDVVPELRPAQDATLSIAGETASVEPHSLQTATLTF